MPGNLGTGGANAVWGIDREVLHGAGFAQEMEALIGEQMEVRERLAPKTDRDKLRIRVEKWLNGEDIKGIDRDVVDKFYLEEKKGRHLMQDERRRLHKPDPDGKLITSSVNLNDILPKAEKVAEDKPIKRGLEYTEFV